MLGRNREGFAVAILAAVVGLSTLPAPPVLAEVSQKEGVRVSVVGKIAPSKLFRSGDTPVAISLSARIAATIPGALPKLERIAIAINSHGELQNRSIPICRLGHIDPSTTSEALLACRSSLVGEGHFSADVKIPEQSPFPSEGKVLLFNGRLGGEPALLAHIYGTRPVPTAYVLPFLIGSSRGTYGTSLRASLPNVTGEWGYVTGVSLNLRRRFLSASCPAPKGFPGAVFPLIKASFGFDGGLELSSTLTRGCGVR
jgi:hypothetical protein